jgi:SNF2 family DNA or RNA helicase
MTAADPSGGDNISHWLRTEAGLVAVHADGTHSALSARQVWSAAFSENSDQRALLTPLELAGLRFSRFPADPVLIITGNIIEGLVAELAVICDGEEQSIRAPDIDQVIRGHFWYAVDRESVQQSLRLLAEHGIAPGKPLGLGQMIWLQSNPDIDMVVVDRVSSAPASTVSATAPVESIPGLQGQLYAYQKTGIAFLYLVATQGLGCILGDEMGLGKTLQVIGLLQKQKNDGKSPFLVVCPATLLENWRRELSQFAPGLHVLIHAGDKRVGAVQGLLGYDVVVTSYETAVRDESFLSSIRWKVIAIDEAQNIKNPDALRTKCIKRFQRDTSIAVTGTPVENRLTDLWSIADFALPGLLGSVSDFEAAFDDTHEDASRLAPLVAPILLRRRVMEVATDLPERIDVPQAIEMPANMAQAYESIRQETLAAYGASGSLVALQRLRMFSAHPYLITNWCDDPAQDMPKFQRLMELLEEIFSVGEKALVFSSYNRMADLMTSYLRSSFKHAFVDFIDGRIPVPNRQTTVDKFSRHQGYGALVLNPKAAGTGLNITAANHVIHYNPEWNPAVEDQASARAYRRKQTRPVTIHHLFFVDTVEEVMVDRLHFKRGLAEGAATGHQGGVDSADMLRALNISPVRV